MVRIGFISEQQIKPKRVFWKKYNEEFLRSPSNPFELVAVTVPFSKNSFLHLNDKRRNKVLEKAIRSLSEKGTEKILLSPFLKETLTEKGIEMQVIKEKELFFSWAYGCVKKVSLLCGINLFEAKVCIRADKLERLSENLMAQLCFDVKNLFVCTPKNENVRTVCNRFFEETGMYVRVVERAAGDEDIMIDTDRLEVRVGRDMIIDGAAPEYEIGDFEIELPELAACVAKKFDVDEKLSFFSGKKKLTL